MQRTAKETLTKSGEAPPLLDCRNAKLGEDQHEKVALQRVFWGHPSLREAVATQI